MTGREVEGRAGGRDARERDSPVAERQPVGGTLDRGSRQDRQPGRLVVCIRGAQARGGQIRVERRPQLRSDRVHVRAQVRVAARGEARRGHVRAAEPNTRVQVGHLAVAPHGAGHVRSRVAQNIGRHARCGRREQRGERTKRRDAGVEPRRQMAPISPGPRRVEDRVAEDHVPSVDRDVTCGETRRHLRTQRQPRRLAEVRGVHGSAGEVRAKVRPDGAAIAASVDGHVHGTVDEQAGPRRGRREREHRPRSSARDQGEAGERGRRAQPDQIDRAGRLGAIAERQRQAVDPQRIAVRSHPDISTQRDARAGSAFEPDVGDVDLHGAAQPAVVLLEREAKADGAAGDRPVGAPQQGQEGDQLLGIGARRDRQGHEAAHPLHLAHGPMAGERHGPQRDLHRRHGEIARRRVEAEISLHASVNRRAQRAGPLRLAWPGSHPRELERAGDMEVPRALGHDVDPERPARDVDRLGGHERREGGERHRSKVDLGVRDGARHSGDGPERDELERDVEVRRGRGDGGVHRHGERIVERRARGFDVERLDRDGCGGPGGLVVERERAAFNREPVDARDVGGGRRWRRRRCLAQPGADVIRREASALQPHERDLRLPDLDRHDLEIAAPRSQKRPYGETQTDEADGQWWPGRIADRSLRRPDGDVARLRERRLAEADMHGAEGDRAPDPGLDLRGAHEETSPHGRVEPADDERQRGHEDHVRDADDYRSRPPEASPPVCGGQPGLTMSSSQARGCTRVSAIHSGAIATTPHVPGCTTLRRTSAGIHTRRT